MSLKRFVRRMLSPAARIVLRHEIKRIVAERDAFATEIQAMSAKTMQPRHYLLDGIFPADETAEPLPEQICGVAFGARALWKLLKDYDFQTVLDIGSGQGQQASVLLEYGKSVTALDYGESPYFKSRDPRVETVIGDFNTVEFAGQFDCVWASHVLEHQLDPQNFLRRVHQVTKEGGVIAISVPPLKHQIVGGHVSLWNGGLLLYRLVLAGFDCREASLLQYGYNISVVVRKKSIPAPSLVFDMGDIRTIRPYLPASLPFAPNQYDDPFDGNILRLNW